MKRRAANVGRLRIKLCALLIAAMKEQHGRALELTPDKIRPAQGRNRSDPAMDIYRWEAFGRLPIAGGNGLSCTIDSYATITDCVRCGVLLTHDRGTAYDAHARGL